MNRLSVFSKKVCCEDNEFTLYYYLTSVNSDDGYLITPKSYYGIAIEKKMENGEDEFSAVSMISEDSREVFAIISRLYESTVTPIALPEIMEDYEHNSRRFK